ncbi:MAG TPA: ATP-binding protein [Candidatus Bathyarchaeia archaeon]|nr:ATP-binding protein [Candidatus Bathyarchaeia archaeon]
MIDDTRVFSKMLAFGLAGIAAFYATMTTYQLSSGAPPVHKWWLAYPIEVISCYFVIPTLMYFATKYPWAKLPAIIYFHLAMAIISVWFTEVYSPFTVVWCMYTLVASIYFGWKGFIGSIFVLYAQAAWYVLAFAKDLLPSFAVYAVLSVLVCTITTFTAYLFVRIIMAGQRQNKELQFSRHSEQTQVYRLNTLLNSISDAVMTLNRYGRVTSQNAAAQGFFDTNESLIGRSIDQLLQMRDMNDAPVSMQQLLSKIKSSSFRDDLSVGSGGDTRHISIQMSRIRGTYADAEEYGVVLIIRDITKQKTLEEEKDEFISVTSHELRTPVAIAEGSLSNLLLMHERKMPEQKLLEAANEAHTQVIYLANMINDLSTLSRAERGVGDVTEPIEVIKLLHELFARYTPEAQAKALSMDLDAGANLPQIETSRLYLEEILQNFLTNAIKYTAKGSVTLGAKMESDSRIRFFVKDTGIGISKPDLEHIFEKFYRSEDYRTRETSGTGLGLYVVKKLADKLDTKIEVDSRLNEGSTFSFVMGLKTSRLALADKAASAEAPPTPADVVQTPSPAPVLFMETRPATVQVPERAPESAPTPVLVPEPTPQVVQS